VAYTPRGRLLVEKPASQRSRSSSGCITRTRPLLNLIGTEPEAKFVKRMTREIREVKA